jgi:hypothetical protein
MADKSFGVKEIELIGASGTPTIESPNNLDIKAVNVAISTDITVGGMVSLGAGTSISSPGTNVLTFGTNSTEKVRITSGGLIGVNVIPTQQKLTIDVDSSGTTQASFDGINICNTDSTTNNGAAIIFGQTVAGNSNARIGVINSDRSSGSEDQDIFFGTLGGGSYGERLRITSNGNIGMGGITSPSFTTGNGLHLGDNYAIGFGAGGNSRPDFQIVSDGSSLDFRCGFGADTADISMTTGGNLVFANGGGIDFSATGDGSGTVVSELFDDYEEGNFTPTVEWGGTSATLSGATYGRYTKIGNTVIINFRITQTARNTTSGSIRMYGLPYNEGSTAAYNHGMVQIDSGGNMPSGAGSIMMYFSTNNVRFLYQTNTGHSDLDASHCVDGTSWYGFATYFTS